MSGKQYQIPSLTVQSRSTRNLSIPLKLAANSILVCITADFFCQEFKVKPDGKNEEVSFRKVLLIRCQREFEQTSRDDDAITVKQAQVANTTDEKEKAQLLEEMELFSTKARKRKLGNIR